MTRAVGSLHRFRWDIGFDPWLFGIARHVCSDHHRRADRERKARELDRVSFAPEPGEALERSAEHAEVRRLFARLTPAEQELLELRVIAGLSADEVAATLRRRPGAVRTAQSRALAHLRKLMEASQ
jgi:RNA polymerase sigma-70 factor (ECF subfamily)